MKITKEQIKAIHTLKHNLKWDDEAYRSFLWGQCRVDTCTALTMQQATDAIKVMASVLEEADRGQRVTPRQVKYIRYLWLQTDYADGNEGDRYLSSYLYKKHGVKSPDELSSSQASGAICAIKRMIVNRNKKTVKVANNIVHDDQSGNDFVWVTLEDGTRVKQNVTPNKTSS